MSENPGMYYLLYIINILPKYFIHTKRKHLFTLDPAVPHSRTHEVIPGTSLTSENPGTIYINLIYLHFA